jgi:hypothetical protein
MAVGVDHKLWCTVRLCDDLTAIVPVFLASSTSRAVLKFANMMRAKLKPPR